MAPDLRAAQEELRLALEEFAAATAKHPPPAVLAPTACKATAAMANYCTVLSAVAARTRRGRSAALAASALALVIC